LPEKQEKSGKNRGLLIRWKLDVAKLPGGVQRHVELPFLIFHGKTRKKGEIGEKIGIS
jgi:hypothetical protein